MGHRCWIVSLDLIGTEEGRRDKHHGSNPKLEIRERNKTNPELLP